MIFLSDKDSPSGGKFSIPLEIDDWLRKESIPFESIEPDHSFDDLKFLTEVIGDARLVALGEATHGTHEFFQMKHRLLRFLVEEMKFNILALEASWPHSNLMDEYVCTGQGDPIKLLAGLGYWIWNTQEMLDVVRWMRAHNRVAGNQASVHFFGFDIVFPGPAMDDVVEYVRQKQPEAAPRIAALYEGFRKYKYRMQSYADLPSENKAQCRDNLLAAYDWLLQQRPYLESRSSAETFARMLQGARVVVQAEDYYAHLREDPDALRDLYMAENIGWLLDQAGPAGKLAVWAHNGHVSLLPSRIGGYLREKYRKEMVSFGFSFSRGSFNAMRVYDSGRLGGLEPFQAGSPPEDSFESLFSRSERPRFFLDLRDIEHGSRATEWLLVDHPFRIIGAVYRDSDPGAYFEDTNLAKAFDGIIHFQDTTPSMLLSPALSSKNISPERVNSLPHNLDFEEGTSGWILGSSHPEEYEVGTDSLTVYDGKRSGYIRSTRDKVDGLGTLMQKVKANGYRGQRLCMSVYVKTKNIEGWAGLWIAVYSSGRAVSFENMNDRPIVGEIDWTRYDIRINVPEAGTEIAYGVQLVGSGQVWLNDFQFRVMSVDEPTADSQPTAP